MTLNAPVNWQQRAQHVDVQLNAELGAAQVIRRMRARRNADGGAISRPESAHHVVASLSYGPYSARIT